MRRIAVGPTDRFRVLVVASDVAPDLPREVRDRGEDPLCEEVALDLGKPEFDLIDPRRVSRREMRVDPRMGLEKRLDSFGLVRRQGVDDYVDLTAPRLCGQHVAEELDASLVCRGTVCPTISAVVVLSAAQPQGAVPVILEAVAFGAPGESGISDSTSASALSGPVSGNSRVPWPTADMQHVKQIPHRAGRTTAATDGPLSSGAASGAAASTP